MAGPHTARARARAMMIDDIKARGVAQLATEGAAQLSLRAIARDLGLVSSGIYRYYPSRDDLLTDLIIDAFSDLAEAVGSADADIPRSRYRRRWVARAGALRSWARAEPQRFGLIYGTTVPGYRAPDDTLIPAAAVIAAMLGVLAEAAAAGRLDPRPAPRGRRLRSQLEGVSTAFDLDLPAGTVARAVAALGELIGLITLELGGHLVGGFEPADDLYTHCVGDLGDQLGLLQ